MKIKEKSKFFARMLVICFVFIVFVSSVNAAEQWVSAPGSCSIQDPTNFPGQNCTPDNICGDNGMAQCYDTATLTPPAGPATSNTRYSTGHSGGGYLINCYATVDAAAPYCDNSGSFWCNRNETCYGTQHRDTTCTGGSWGTATCGSCRTGFADCDAGGDACEIQFGTTDYPTGAHNNYSTCTTAQCDSGWIDHDGGGIDATNGCEIEVDEVCTMTTGGLPGTCASSGANTGTADSSGEDCACSLPKEYFETGTQASYLTTDPLLWGRQFGAGNLINFGNGITDDLFMVNNDGAVQMGQITAPGTTTDRLYNVGGDLYWNGGSLSSGSTDTLYSADGSLSETRTVSIDTNRLQFDASGQTGLLTLYGSTGVGSHVGIGTVAPNYLLDVFNENAAVSSDKGAHFSYNVQPALMMTSPKTHTNMDFYIKNSHDAPMTELDIKGVSNRVDLGDNSGTDSRTTEAIGAENSIYQYGSNSTVTANINPSSFYHYGTGTVTDVFGNQNHISLRDSGNLTNAYSFYSDIGDSSGSGTIANAYALYGTYDGTITNKWGVYLDGEDSSYFSGDVGIGISTPSTALHIDSNAASNAAISTFENTAGDFQLFRTDATPEGSVTGSIGDIAVDSTGGSMYIKETGNGTNAGWAEINSGSISVDTVYSANGSLTGDRTIDLDGNELTIDGGFMSSVYTEDIGIVSTITDTDIDLESIFSQEAGDIILSSEDTSFGDKVDIHLSETGFVISGTSGFEGATYGADYATNFTARSLVDRAYVDDAVTAISTDTLYSADGALAGARTVSMGTNDLQFDSTGQTGLLTLDTTNNRVGIGTDTPNNTFQVAGLLDFHPTNHSIKLGNTTNTTNTGLHNIFAGYEAGRSNTNGQGNLFMGYNAGEDNTTGQMNIALGYQSGINNDAGDSNVFVGDYSGYSNVSGDENTFVGSAAGRGVGGDQNTMIGQMAGYAASATSRNNVVIGRAAGYDADGNYNTAIGNRAGYNADGDYNVFIGNEAGYDETGSNTLYIDNSNTATPLIYGDFNNDALTINGDLTVNNASANTVAISTFENTAGDFQLFRTDATPEGSVTGSIGDLAVDSTNGSLYIKETGSSTNTGWSAVGGGGDTFPMPPNIVLVDPDESEVAGERYQTWAAADTYVQTQTPGAANVWGIKITGTNAEDIIVRSYINIIGEGDSTNLTGELTSTATGYVDGIMADLKISDLSITGATTLYTFNVHFAGGTPAGGYILSRFSRFYGGDYSSMGFFQVFNGEIYGGTYGDISISNTTVADWMGPITFNGMDAYQSHLALGNGNAVWNSGNYEIEGCYVNMGSSDITITDGEWKMANSIVRYEETLTLAGSSGGLFANVSTDDRDREFTVTHNGTEDLRTTGLDGNITINGTGNWVNQGIRYDNDSSGLSADNTQDAIDELAGATVLPTGTNHGQMLYWDGGTWEAASIDKLSFNEGNTRLAIGVDMARGVLHAEGMNPSFIIADTDTYDSAPYTMIKNQLWTGSTDAFQTNMSIILTGKETTTDFDTSAYMAFQVNDGAGAPIEAMRITSDKYLVIGDTVADSAFHVDSNGANTTAISTFENTAGDFQLFRTDATPESSVTGSIGDLAIDGTNGDLYIKESGDATNTGWSAVGGGAGGGIYAGDGSLSGDTTVTMGTNDLQFDSTGQDGIFTIDTTNNRVGIGTDTPSSRLTIAGGALKLDRESAPGPPTVAVNASAGNLNGAYRYRVTFVTTEGETSASNYSATVSPVSQQVNLSAIPTGSADVTARKIYRTEADAGWPYITKLVTTILDNTTTAYTDNIADGSLGAAAPFDNTTGGEIYFGNNRGINISGISMAIGENAGGANQGYETLFIGLNSGSSNTTGSGNMFVGQYSGQYNTTGHNNLFLGNMSGRSNTTGNSNTALGKYAGYTNSTGSDNAFFGYGAGYYNEASYNTFLGSSAGYNNTSGNNNAFFGRRAGYSNDTGYANTFFGSTAGYDNVDGDQNIFFGNNAGQHNVDGSMNTFIGTQAGQENDDDQYNLAIGHRALEDNILGDANTAIGYMAGHEAQAEGLTTIGYRAGYVNGKNRIAATNEGYYNTFIGSMAGEDNDRGERNTFIGYGAGQETNHVDADYNTFVGAFAGADNTEGFQNTFIGGHAGQNTTTGDDNTFIGAHAGNANTTGGSNMFLGSQAGSFNEGGSRNTFMGSLSGYDNVSGDDNTFLGFHSGENTTASTNTFIGSYSGQNNVGGLRNVFLGTLTGADNISGNNNLYMGPGSGRLNTAGNNNVFLGRDSGYSNTGSSNVFIGDQVGYNETGSNLLYIDNSNTAAPLVYGDFSTDMFTINGGAIFNEQGADKNFRVEGVANANVLFVDASADSLGIRTNTPRTALDVVASGEAVATFDRTTDDGTLISLRQGGVEEGTISVSGNTVSYNAFTGSHYVWTYDDIMKGLLVEMTGDNRHLHDNEESEILYGIKVSDQKNSKKILGSYLSILEPSKEPNLDNPSLVMAEGNGDLWVVDTGYDVEVGDYLVSSDVLGHAQKIDGSFAINYVVARTAESIDWNEVTESINGAKHKKISVFFDNMVINTDTADYIKTEELSGKKLMADKLDKKELDLESIQVAPKLELTATKAEEAKEIIDSVESIKNGTVKLEKNNTTVRVSFAEKLDKKPTIVLTLVSDVAVPYMISKNVDSYGFTVDIKDAQDEDLYISWYVVGDEDDSITEASVEDIIDSANIGIIVDEDIDRDAIVDIIEFSSEGDEAEGDEENIAEDVIEDDMVEEILEEAEGIEEVIEDDVTEEVEEESIEGISTETEAAEETEVVVEEVPESTEEGAL